MDVKIKIMKLTAKVLGLLVIFLIFNANFVANYKPNKSENSQSINQNSGGEMKITTVFEDMGQIPSVYTCDGQDLAPVLNISDVPKDAKELALIVDDPDAPVGTWVHWVLYNIPANTTMIDNNNLAPEIKLGMTDFGRLGWGGPCPPNGEHRYFFKLYALDTHLDLPIGETKKELENAMQGHIIKTAQIVGLYDRIR